MKRSNGTELIKFSIEKVWKMIFFNVWEPCQTHLLQVWRLFWVLLEWHTQRFVWSASCEADELWIVTRVVPPICGCKHQNFTEVAISQQICWITFSNSYSIIRIIHYPISFDITPVTRPQSNPCFGSICGWERL